MQQEFVPIVVPVKQVDWTSSTVDRAGICPIYRHAGHRFVGFGISNHSSVIAPLGGSFESEDYDLLSTAVREYNEEVGPNYAPVTEEEITNCYAALNKDTIQVFLEINAPTREFQPTQELYDMLWVTPNQLNAISRNQEYRFRGSSKIFQVGSRFRDLLDTISEAVRTDIAFGTFKGQEHFNRNRKVVEVKQPQVYQSYEKFFEDSRLPNTFLGHIGVVVTPQTIGVIGKSKDIYLFPNTKNNLKTVGDLGIKIYVSKQSDVNNFPRNATIKVITKAFPFTRTEMKETTRRFEQNVEDARFDDDIIRELQLISQYEQDIYDYSDRTGSLFQEIRATILAAITFINARLSYYPELTIGDLEYDLKGFIRNRTRQNIPEVDLLRELSRLGFYTLDFQRNSIFIK